MARILCIGDSHAEMIGTDLDAYPFKYGKITPRKFQKQAGFVLSVRAATAGGIANQGSQTQSRRLAEASISRLKPDLICFGFGQVDAEITCYLHALRNAGKVPENRHVYFRNTYARYLQSCKEIAGEKRFVIKGINPATFRSDDSVRDYIGSQLKRYLDVENEIAQNCLLEFLGVNLEKHCEINQTAMLALRELCHDNNVPYFDIRNLVSDPATCGLARKEFTRRRPDPHLVLSGVERAKTVSRLLALM